MSGRSSDKEIVEGAVRRFRAENKTLISRYAEVCYEAFLKNANAEFLRAVKADNCPREKLESFEVLGVLKSGACGIVLKAKHKDGSVVAIKVMDKLIIESKNCARSVCRERKLILALRSDFIVKMLYAFQDPHRLYLVMELAFYGDLERWIDLYDSLEEELLKLFAAQMVSALQYLHVCFIIHRDLKPANFMLFRDGYIKLGDLGISKRTRRPTTSLTGTPPYMAPEVIAGKGYSFPVDWFSLGATLFEMMFKTYAYCNYSDPIGVLIASGTVNDLVFPQGYSNEARDLIAQLLRKSVSERIGAGERDAIDVMEHVWFKDVNFSLLHLKRIEMRAMLPDYLAAVEADAERKVPESPGLCKNDSLFMEF